MAISEQDVKRRIDSTRKTRQITSAMQMVSTAKLSQIQKHTVGYQVYEQKVESIVAHLAKSHLMDAGSAGNSKSDDSSVSAGDLLRQRPVKKSGYLVITSDRGLVGSYNSNVIKQTNDFMAKMGHDKNDSVILAVGGTGADFYKQRGMNVAYEYRGVSDVPTFNEIREIVKMVTSMYVDGGFDELFVCYNHFVNRLTNEFASTKMLPIGEEDIASESDETIAQEYDTEPSPEQLLQTILPQYAESLVYGAILDAKTAEHAASSSAMQAASDNAKDLIASLELQYNRARQSAITTEITEITGGMAALE